MARDDHPLMSTPVSVNDGFKRADGRTWLVLGVTAVIAIVIVGLISLFVEKPDVKWPQSPTAPQPAPAADQPGDEPRVYDVAPPAPAPR